MTIPLEVVSRNGQVDELALQRNIDNLARLILDTGGVSLAVRIGTSTITWAGGSAFSTATAVTHGLGTTPKIVIVGVNASSGLTATPSVESRSFGATTFTAQCGTVDAQVPANTSTTAISWIAIG